MIDLAPFIVMLLAVIFTWWRMSAAFKEVRKGMDRLLSQMENLEIGMAHLEGAVERLEESTTSLEKRVSALEKTAAKAS